MDTRRLLLAFALSLAVLILWGKLFPPPSPPDQTPAPTQAPSEAAPVERPAETPVPDLERPVEQVEPPPAPTERIAADAEQRVTVEGDWFRATFTNRGAQLISFLLLDHRTAEGGSVDLVRAREETPFPFAVVSSGGEPHPVNNALFVVARETGDEGEQVLRFRYSGPEGSVGKWFGFRHDGLIEVRAYIEGERGWGMVQGPGVHNPSADELGNRFARRSAIYQFGKDLERVDAQGAGEPTPIPAAGLQWIGLQDTYFLVAAIPRTGLEGATLGPVVMVPGQEGEAARFRPFLTEAELTGEQEDLIRELVLNLRAADEELSFLAYWGPKEYERLAALPYGLERSVNLGWFRLFALPLLYGLQWIHDNIVANYGWAIILLTVVIRVLLFPFTHMSMVSMQKMQGLNPKIQAIRQKYRPKLKDRQGRPNAEAQRKMNEEIMALYKSEGVNPAGGCLPLLLQFPVLIAFYYLLSAAIEIRGAPWILWIADLSVKDPFYVLPIVMGASQFVQQKMTPAAGDPMQRRLFALMPIFFTILFLGFPSGLVLYWLTNNLLGILQQVVYQRIKARREDSTPAKGSAGAKSKRGA